ncbi:MAG: Gfo/Idh/MocA family oxidoreductase [Anaerolineaceae bacterium]|nr:Gfo/Idh/MocA family oxidoreductase [Anaerolineaceae bacterium]
MTILSSLKEGGNIFKKPEVRWGVLGTARIAKNWVIPAINNTKHNKVIAVASRDLSKAVEFATPLQIAKAFGDYEDMISDPEIDAVYIPLPNGGHAAWAIKAMEAGKNVLVEKPFALSADEAQKMVSVSLDKNVVLMEAFMYRYNSRFDKFIQIVRFGDIGKIRFIESSFTFNLTNPDDIRMRAEQGGGALYDLGCYCVNFHRQLANREPSSVHANMYQGSTNVDLQMSCNMEFDEAVHSHFNVSFNAIPQQSTRVIGSEGLLEIELPFNPHAAATTAILTKNGEMKTLNFKAENDYEKMVAHFYELVIRRAIPKFPLSDAINNLIAMQALLESARNGGLVVKL